MFYTTYNPEAALLKGGFHLGIDDRGFHPQIHGETLHSYGHKNMSTLSIDAAAMRETSFVVINLKSEISIHD